MHIGKAITGNLLAGSLGRIINALTPLLLVPLMIRTWGLHQYGEWLILTAIPTYMMLSPDFGLAGAVNNQMAKSTAEGRRGEAICLYRTSWLILSVMGAIFVLIGTFLVYLVNWRLFGITVLVHSAAPIVLWSLVQIFLGQQLTLLCGVYRSARRNPRGGAVTSLGYAFYLLVGCTTLALGGGPVAFVAASVGARVTVLAAMLLDARRVMPDFTLSLKGVSVRAVRPFVIPGLGHAAMPLINAFQNEGMLLVVGALLGPVSVAIFQTTRTAVNGAKSLTGLVSSAVMLEIPALVGEKRINAVRRLLVINTQAALAATFCWFAMLALFGEPIFHLWLRSKAVYSTPLVLIMLASIFPFAISGSFGILLLATNQIHRAVLLLLPAGLFSLITTAVGCHLLGVNGAASGPLFFESLSLLVVSFVAAKRTSIEVRATLAEVFSLQSFGATYRSLSAVSRDTFRLIRELLPRHAPDKTLVPETIE